MSVGEEKVVIKAGLPYWKDWHLKPTWRHRGASFVFWRNILVPRESGNLCTIREYLDFAYI